MDTLIALLALIVTSVEGPRILRGEVVDLEGAPATEGTVYVYDAFSARVQVDLDDFGQYEVPIREPHMWLMIDTPGNMLIEEQVPDVPSRELQVLKSTVMPATTIPISFVDMEGERVPAQQVLQVLELSVCGDAPHRIRSEPPRRLFMTRQNARVCTWASIDLSDESQPNLVLRSPVSTFVILSDGIRVVSAREVPAKADGVCLELNRKHLEPQRREVFVRVINRDSKQVCVQGAWVDGDLGVREAVLTDGGCIVGVPVGAHVITLDCLDYGIVRLLFDTEALEDDVLLCELPPASLVTIQPVDSNGRPYGRKSYIECRSAFHPSYYDAASIPGKDCEAGASVGLPTCEPVWVRALGLSMDASSEWQLVQTFEDQVSLTMIPHAMTAIVPSQEYIDSRCLIVDSNGDEILDFRFTGPRPFVVKLQEGSYELFCHDTRTAQFDVGVNGQRLVWLAGKKGR